MGSLPNIAAQAVKKRKFSESPPETISSGMMHGINGVLNIKQEPPGVQLNSYMSECSGGEDDFASYELDSNGTFVDSTYQVIKWRHYAQSQWAILTDADLKDLSRPQYRVDADKGFNYSTSDEAFVCQKKNHFQVTVHMRLYGNAKYVRTEEGVKQIENFQLHFYGVKMESQNQQIKLEQSQADRSKKSFHPVQVDLTADKDTKVTICRLHFSETTSNNMRKKGKPNPDQRYFLLVVSLHAHSGPHDYMITGSVSDRIIVRASNPAQFDNDVDVMWQRGQNQESVYHVGKVGVNTDHPEEALTVHGNMRLTGALTQPSDKRAKEKIQEIDPRDQLENVSKMRLYTFSYREDYADQMGIPPDNRNDAGVLAQDVLSVLPDAVLDTGDVTLPSGETIENFLVVNKDRIFLENMGAVIELCRVTGKLEGRVDQLEKVNKQLKKLKRHESFKSTASSMSLGSTMSTTSDSSSKVPSERQVSGATPKPLREHQTAANCSQNAAKKSSCSTSLKSLISRGSSSTSPSGSSSVLGPVKKISNKQITIVILGLIMALTIIILSTMYILVIRKTDDQSQNPVLHDDDPGKNPNNHTQLHATTIRTDVASTLSGQMTTPSGLATTASTARTTTHVRPSQQPVVPPYPRCTQGYCEKLCCPAPHEDRPAIIINHGDGGGDVAYNPSYSVDQGNAARAPYGEDDEPPVVVSHVVPATENPFHNPGGVDVSMYGSNRFKPNTLGYNVINNFSRQKPHYSVISHTNHRRKRGADDAPRPEIRIMELNYSLTDDFCFHDGCNGNHVYSYYVPLNSSFGYDNITLELRTPTMSHMALCSSHFMWSCPDAPRGNGIDGHIVQQTDVAQWSLRIGNHFRTILNLMVIHSIKGLSVIEPCQLRSDENFVVMNYTLQFQRTC